MSEQPYDPNDPNVYDDSGDFATKEEARRIVQEEHAKLLANAQKGQEAVKKAREDDPELTEAELTETAHILLTDEAEGLRVVKRETRERKGLPSREQEDDVLKKMARGAFMDSDQSDQFISRVRKQREE